MINNSDFEAENMINALGFMHYIRWRKECYEGSQGDTSTDFQVIP